MLKSLITSVCALGLCGAALAQTGADVVVPLQNKQTILDAKSYVDTYDPTKGPYGGANVYGAPTFSLGNVLPDLSAPTGVASLSADVVHDKVNVTLSSNMVVDNYTLINWANLTIKGDITLVVNKKFAVSNQSKIILDTDARLTIYCLGDASINDHCVVNSDTTRPSAVRIIKLGTSPMYVQNQSKLVGMVYVPNSNLSVINGSDFYGGLRAKSLYLANTGAGHFTTVGPCPTTTAPMYD